MTSIARAEEEEKPPAPREQLGSERQLVLSVERLFSIDSMLPRTYGGNYADGDSSWSTESSSTLSLLNRPAVAVDGFLWKHLSLGMKASLFGGNQKSEGRSVFDGVTYTSQLHSSGLSLVLAPRVGLAFTSESGLGVWARAGADLFFNANSVAQEDTSQGRFEYRSSNVDYGVEGELLLTYSPLPNVALMAGPYYQGRFPDRVPALHSVGFNVNAGIFL